MTTIVTEQTFTKTCQERFESLTIDQMKELTLYCFQNEDPAVTNVLDEALGYLESIMEEGEFIALCDSME